MVQTGLNIILALKSLQSCKEKTNEHITVEQGQVD